MLKKKINTSYFQSPNFKSFYKDKVNNYIQTTIRAKKLSTQKNRKLHIGLTDQPINSNCDLETKRILTQSLNITPIRPSISTIPQTERKSLNIKRKFIITETSAFIRMKKQKDQLAQSVRLKQEMHDVCWPYLGHYNIFSYITRTNVGMINQRLLVQAFKEKNKKKKVNYALISQINKQKFNLSPDKWMCPNKTSYQSIEDLPNNEIIKTINTFNYNDKREKKVNDHKCKASLFITNLEIMNKLLEEKNNEEDKLSNIENALKKELVKLLLQKNNKHQNFFHKMDIQLKKDIRKYDYQVKNTLDDLRRLQHVNDNKLTKKAFILKDIY